MGEVWSVLCPADNRENVEKTFLSQCGSPIGADVLLLLGFLLSCCRDLFFFPLSLACVMFCCCVMYVAWLLSVWVTTMGS